MTINKCIYLSIITIFAFFILGYFVSQLFENVNASSVSGPPSINGPPVCKDISGKWDGNDGGTYFIQQNGQSVSWFGSNNLGEGKGFSNVFVGRHGGDTVSGSWADTPMGSFKNSGDLEFRCLVEKGIDTIRLIHQTGGFGGTVFVKNHIKNDPQRMVRGDCETSHQLILFHDGKALWRAFPFSHSGDVGPTGDVFVVKGIQLKDQDKRILFTIPKFVSPELPGDLVLPDLWAQKLSFPPDIFNQIRSWTVLASC
jgi:hypothetical protein